MEYVYYFILLAEEEEDRETHERLAQLDVEHEVEGTYFLRLHESVLEGACESVEAEGDDEESNGAIVDHISVRLLEIRGRVDAFVHEEDEAGRDGEHVEVLVDGVALAEESSKEHHWHWFAGLCQQLHRIDDIPDKVEVKIKE